MARHNQVLCVVVGLLLLATLPLLGSDTKALKLSEISPKVTKVEFKVGQGEWSEVDLDSKKIEIFNSNEELFIRQYKGSSLVGGELIYNYDVNQETWVYRTRASDEKVEVTLSPYATTMFTNKALNHMYTLSFGVGFDSEFSFSFYKELIFKFAIESKYAKSNNIWADHFLIFGSDVGVGYRFQLGNGLLLTPSLLYGLSFHCCLNTSLEKPLQLQHLLKLDLQTGYKFAPDMSVFVAPNIQYMLDSTRNGLLFGLRAGVGFIL